MLGEALRPATQIGGMGVDLHVDRDAEEFYLDVSPDHDPMARSLCLLAATAWGLELMPENECQPDVLPDGTIRHYFAEVIRC